MSFLARRNWLSSIRGSLSIAEHQLIIRLGPIVLQHHRGIIGFPGFLRETAGELYPALVQQGGGNGLGERLFLGGEKLAVFPQDKAALPIFTEKPFLLSVTAPPQRGQGPTASLFEGNKTAAPGTGW